MSCRNPDLATSAFTGLEPCKPSACDLPTGTEGGDNAAGPPCQLMLIRLAPGVAATSVADIFKRCRERHGQLHITGAVLFDGERFGALLCGAPGMVGRAAAALRADPRLAAPLLLATADEVPAWAAKGWHAGWCEPDALATLAAPQAPRGPAALQAWRALVAASDLL